MGAAFCFLSLSSARACGGPGCSQGISSRPLWAPCFLWCFPAGRSGDTRAVIRMQQATTVSQ